MFVTLCWHGLIWEGLHVLEKVLLQIPLCNALHERKQFHFFIFQHVTHISSDYSDPVLSHSTWFSFFSYRKQTHPRLDGSPDATVSAIISQHRINAGLEANNAQLGKEEYTSHMVFSSMCSSNSKFWPGEKGAYSETAHYFPCTIKWIPHRLQVP